MSSVADNPENPSKKQPVISEDDPGNQNLFSPRFRSVAAMAGWDEEALLIATHIVEDTPDRLRKQRRRSDLRHLKTPPTNSRRKRNAHRNSQVSIPVTVLDLEDEDDSTSNQQGCVRENIEVNTIPKVEKNREPIKEDAKDSAVSSSSPVIHCLDQLREELSCAICLEICYEPSTTPCGHSFCKQCLRSAADKCGKRCPKCRQLISNWRSCTVNTVLWNTIQLLFPKEVKQRKPVTMLDTTTEATRKESSPVRTRNPSMRNRSIQALNSPETDGTDSDRRIRRRLRSRSSRTTGRGEASVSRDLPSQDEDSALALRLQREEFMEAFRVVPGERISLARANLRAMASRATNIHSGRSTINGQLIFETVNSDSGRSTVNSDLNSQQSTQILTLSSQLKSGQLTVNSDLDTQHSTQIWTVNSQLKSGHSTVNSDLANLVKLTNFNKLLHAYRSDFTIATANLVKLPKSMPKPLRFTGVSVVIWDYGIFRTLSYEGNYGLDLLEE
ncbi:hypothetical protein F511_29470 [Dorcoceras hygrometricum]|uniref:RING-type E3 ubiquitin transferase n=1 Tax=Dorcoceras hygrometricum TaxID=472368 RepID=A0A2Z7A8L2_9LAMI|nr:hypothetical protein F511_29470 [Dorcoceras hygrometricum]